MGEVEIERITVQTSPGKKVWETPYKWKKAGHGGTGLLSL
jgi:hypothetical protein